MPYTVGYAPAPLTFNVRRGLDWQVLLVVAWLCFMSYQIFQLFVTARRQGHPEQIIDLAMIVVISIGALMSLIRRESIEIYVDRMVWRKTYFGITRSHEAPLPEVLGAQWTEGQNHGRRGKGPDYVEFYLPNASVKACYGLSFDEWDRMREDIRLMYPDLIRRWGSSSVRSKDLTLLNLN